MNSSVDEITQVKKINDELKKELHILNEELNIKTNVLSGCKQQLSLIQEQENVFQQKINDLQSTKHNTSNDNKIKQLQNELQELKNTFKVELSEKDEECTSLYCELNELNEVEEVPVNNPSDELLEECLSLEQSLQEIKDNIMEKSMLADDLQTQNYILIESVHNLKEELEQMTEKIQVKEDDLTKASVKYDTLEEELALMKSELHSLQSSKSLAVVKQESIFSEVNDRRLSLKDTVSEHEKTYKQKQLHVMEISKKTSLLNRDHNDLKNALEKDKVEIQQNYKSVIDIYKNRQRALKKLTGIFKNVLEQKVGLYKIATTEDTMKYIDSLLEEKQKIETELKDCISTEYVSEKMLFLYLKEINTKICEVKSSLKQLEIKVNEHKRILKDVPVLVDSVKTEMDQTSRVLVEKRKNVKKVGGLKKVTYAEDTIDSKPNKNQARRGGKVLQSETILFIE